MTGPLVRLSVSLPETTDSLLNEAVDCNMLKPDEKLMPKPKSSTGSWGNSRNCYKIVI